MFLMNIQKNYESTFVIRAAHWVYKIKIHFLFFKYSWSRNLLAWEQVKLYSFCPPALWLLDRGASVILWLLILIWVQNCTWNISVQTHITWVCNVLPYSIFRCLPHNSIMSSNNTLCGLLQSIENNVFHLTYVAKELQLFPHCLTSDCLVCKKYLFRLISHLVAPPGCQHPSVTFLFQKPTVFFCIHWGRNAHSFLPVVWYPYISVTL